MKKPATTKLWAKKINLRDDLSEDLATAQLAGCESTKSDQTQYD